MTEQTAEWTDGFLNHLTALAKNQPRWKQATQAAAQAVAEVVGVPTDDEEAGPWIALAGAMAFAVGHQVLLNPNDESVARFLAAPSTEKGTSHE